MMLRYTPTPLKIPIISTILSPSDSSTRLRNWLIFSCAPSKFSSASHVASHAGYPTHFTKYCLLLLPPRSAKILSTSHSVRSPFASLITSPPRPHILHLPIREPVFSIHKPPQSANVYHRVYLHSLRQSEPIRISIEHLRHR